ncbi:SusC/RagA family TonB-linked outer membrane protein [Phocaeicola coprophilus]|nr:SusC/RagA family TonB-linked outer membrane protein [Phocaeicola coprophilus]
MKPISLKHRLRYSFLLLASLTLLPTTESQAQERKEEIRLEVTQKPLSQVFRQLEKSTDYKFMFSHDDVKGLQVTRKVQAGDIETVLKQLLEGLPLTYSIKGKFVYIVPKKGVPAAAEQSKKTVRGQVVDAAGNPLPGVSILVKGTKTGTATDLDGNYSLDMPAEGHTLLFSMIGMKNVEERVGKRTNVNVTMEENAEMMDEVVVTGYQQLKKNAFTGNATVVTKDQLLKTNNKNAIAALQAFEPSFRLKEANLWGSDPNNLPEFTIRGESSIGMNRGLDVESARRSQRTNLADNPNLPIFILDGFEVSVQKIYDMDINRIESMTILKDAAATALYGSRAANGVIVVTTVAPKPGELRVTYNFTGGMEFPDLSDYNLCNAEEMLQVERLAGLFTGENEAEQLDEDIRYNDLMNEVRRGVKTDWLAQPVRNVFNQTHSMNLSGGVESIRYSVDLNYNTHNGAMKGSFRDVYGVGLTLDYRYKKWLQVMNQVSYTVTKSENSPYGDFSKYAALKPYYAPYDNDGNLLETLLSSNNVANPLYQARYLGSYSGRTTLSDLTDQLSVNLYFTDNFFFKGQFSVTRTDSDTETYVDPKDPSFNDKPSKEKGTLQTQNSVSYNWNVNALFYYNKEINKHFINAVAGVNAQESHNENTDILYRGFQLSNLHSPSYAADQPDKANVARSKDRLVGVLASLNYSYNDIYLADFSFRMDGSSKFGHEDRFAPFWSAGLGINIHNYEFLRNNPVINTLRLRGTYGVTGNVSFPSYAAVSTYQTSDDWYFSTPANTLIALGNPALTWEKTGTWDFGITLEMFNRRLSIEANYYRKETTDQLSQLNIRTSSGFDTFYTNAGTILNKGYELKVNVVPYQDKDWTVALNAMIAGNKNRITELGQDAAAYNQKVQDFYAGKGNEAGNGEYEDLKYVPLTQYYVGASTTAIYAVPSLGIDPSTGKEMFRKRDGSVTHTWNSADIVVCGDTSPKAQGSFGINVGWKGFYLNTNFLFQWGGENYNETLLQKVEEADIENSNVDRRVLTQRWQHPGDVAPYYDMKSTVKTQPTSRFVQKNNYLSFSSLSLGYDFEQKVVQKLHLTSLGLRFNANDLARWSTIREERGTSYPYAKNYSFTLSLGF